MIKSWRIILPKAPAKGEGIPVDDDFVEDVGYDLLPTAFEDLERRGIRFVGRILRKNYERPVTPNEAWNEVRSVLETTFLVTFWQSAKSRYPSLEGYRRAVERGGGRIKFFSDEHGDFESSILRNLQKAYRGQTISFYILTYPDRYDDVIRLLTKVEFEFARKKEEFFAKLFRVLQIMRRFVGRSIGEARKQIQRELGLTEYQARRYTDILWFNDMVRWTPVGFPPVYRIEILPKGLRVLERGYITKPDLPAYRGKYE